MSAPTGMGMTRLGKLSPRQAECLRLVPFCTSGEIATRLQIAPGTVDGYIAEAVEALGAKNRKDAARILSELDASPPEIQGGESLGVGETRGLPPSIPPQPGRDDEWPAAHRLQDVPSRAWGDVDTPWPVGRRMPRMVRLSIGQRIALGAALIVALTLALGILIVAARGLAYIFWVTPL